MMRIPVTVNEAGSQTRAEILSMRTAAKKSPTESDEKNATSSKISSFWSFHWKFQSILFVLLLICTVSSRLQLTK